MWELISFGRVICNTFPYKLSSGFFYNLKCFSTECNSLGRACMSHIINIQQVSSKGGHIKDILELTMLHSDWAPSFYWNMGMISHVNVRPLWHCEAKEGLFGGNHVVGSSRINYVCCRLCKDSFQRMTPFIIFYLWFLIGILCSLWEINVMLLEKRWHLINMLLHTIIFNIVTLFTIGT